MANKKKKSWIVKVAAWSTIGIGAIGALTYVGALMNGIPTSGSGFESELAGFLAKPAMKFLTGVANGLAVYLGITVLKM